MKASTGVLTPFRLTMQANVQKTLMYLKNLKVSNFQY